MSKSVGRLLVGSSLLLLVLASLAVWCWARNTAPVGTALAPASAGMPLAVIGDSDSHSYHDTELIPPANGDRGGRFQATTFQWGEVLGRLRGEEIDLGRWGIHGQGRVQSELGRLRGDALPRMPRKLDYQYNYAVSGYGCTELLGAEYSPVPALAALIRSNPAHWRDGVVVVRIGVNTFGMAKSLDRLAADPQDAVVRRDIDYCLQAIGDSVALLRQQQPALRFVLVGIFNNADWAAYEGRWSSPTELAHINRGLDRFDDGLRGMAKADPGIAFFDDRAWFSTHWGGRDAAGNPDYRDVRLGRLRVANSQGDSPDNATLADGHAGTVWNGLWAQALVQLIDNRFGAGLTPISEAEVASLLEPGRRVASAD